MYAVQGFGIDKFVLWTGLAMALAGFRFATKEQIVTEDVWAAASVPLYLVTVCGVLVVGHR